MHISQPNQPTNQLNQQPYNYLIDHSFKHHHSLLNIPVNQHQPPYLQKSLEIPRSGLSVVLQEVGSGGMGFINVHVVLHLVVPGDDFELLVPLLIDHVHRGPKVSSWGDV